MDELIGAFAQVASNPISRLFIDAIAAVFVFALIAHLLGTRFRARFFQRASATAPQLCTTIGVLGTFAGIFIGLLNFDVAHIDQSVPQLLVGLKIAFGTSIVGMSAAIAFKLVQITLPLASGTTGATGDDIHRALLDIDADAKRGAADSEDRSRWPPAGDFIGGGIEPAVPSAKTSTRNRGRAARTHR